MACRGPEPLEFISKKLLEKLTSSLLPHMLYNDVQKILWIIEEILNQHHQQVVEQNNNLTRWLCHLMESPEVKHMALKQVDHSEMMGFPQWYQHHQEKDARRRAVEEQNRKEREKIEELKSKLTPEEIALIKKL